MYNELFIKIFQELAIFFGTSIEFIMANAPAWLTKFGWYCTLKSIYLPLLIWSVIIIIISFCIYISNYEYIFTKHKLFTFSVIIILFFITVGIHILPCIIAPELVAIEYLMSYI